VEEVVIRLRTQIQRKRMADRLRATMADGLRLALIDPLTGLYNRRYALPHITRIAERAQETGRSFAVMLLDLDRFKAVNDTYGHAAGDVVLAEVAQRIRNSLRGVDLVARIGGEEFLVALPDTALDAARGTAERLRRIIADRPIRLPGALGEITVTASVGLAMGGADGVAVEQVVDFADQALLGSKSEGRNLVTVSRSAA
jgi:two-component system cell cycle response regulator